MNTLRHFMDEKSMDFLLNRLFESPQVPDDEEDTNQEGNET